ncbi:MAG TPA: sugar ABC transporter ATP-binding protein [Propionicimonas sp.]|jgi:inositol transport system ATP-binding protein|uniref:sugar ABC transporter ATP-binding protein n=1 Tax=Propionicimonas sp. TaxID=1955623 RepID=UPI002F41E0C1
MTDEFLLQMQGIDKVFPGVHALDHVDLKVRPGTVHSLMGENGAGKSTLMKVLIGMYQPDGGTITFDGKQVQIPDTATGLALGISMIHQELSPVPEMSVAENIWLGREPLTRFGLISRREMKRATQALFDRWEILINPTKLMKDLSIAQTQMVEIAKAISFDSKLIIMDEPTSAITETEVAHLHRMIGQLRATGTAIIYITHKMDEVFKISDDITVFRDGKHVATLPAAELNRDKLITLMVGRELTHMFPKLDAEIGEVILKVENLHRGTVVKDVSFELRRGEILGFAGLMGAGRTEVLETIFGVFKADSGTITINGKKMAINQPTDAINAGLALLTEDRKLTGIMGVLSVRDNMIMAALPKYSPNGILNRRQIDKDCQAQREALALKTPSLDQLIQNLSGGNQQKVLISRWLLTLPDILMIDEPTRGIDVGAKSEIHRLMSMLAQQGKAIIMVSSEMPEVLGMSDRVVVMHEGRVSGVVDRADATQERIMQLATGPADQAA